MQAAGQLHGHVVEALFGISEHVLDNVAAFDPADDVFNDHPDARNEPIPGLLIRRQLAATRLPGGLMNGGSGHLMPLVGTVAVKLGSFRKARTFFVTELFVMLLPFMEGAQVLHLPIFQATDEAVLHRMAFFFPL